MGSFFVGLMSGTSLDGADAVLADFSAAAPRTLAFASQPFPDRLRANLLTLSEPGADSLELAATVSMELAGIYTRAVESVLAAASVARAQVSAIGCHGQTVRHRPDLGFTIQLNDPARLAESTGIDVVADFRRRDMAAGGQGAPLVPAFHEAVFRDAARARAIVNIGGIANITSLAPGRKTLGFDCGPGNVLLDGWAHRHLGLRYDKDGRWAAHGKVNLVLLTQLLEEPYLAAPVPKSTGRELFCLPWLDARLQNAIDPADVQATLTEFTARTIVESIDRFCPETEEIYLCGGGALNTELVSRITRLAGSHPVARTDALGVAAMNVESMAFAWLAMKCVRHEPVDLTAATGARGPRILGAIYPA